MKQRISIIGLDGCTAGALMGVADIFSTANLLLLHISDAKEELFEIQIVSPDGQSIRCANTYTISVDGGIDLIKEGDVVICLPFAMKAPNRFIEAVKGWHSLASWLRERTHLFSLLVATGSGIFLLAEAGLLTNKETSTAWWFDELFRERYPDIKVDNKTIYTRSDNILCSGVTNSWQDICMYIVREFAGDKYARTVAKYMMIDYDRRGNVPLVFLSQVQTNDAVVNKADVWIQKSLDKKIKLKEIAGHVSVSQSTLIRRFQAALGMSPLTYIQQARLEKCKLLLEISDMTISEIVNKCGYTDESSFRRLFKKTYSSTPTEYRRSVQKTIFSNSSEN